jgi:transcriptional regulator with XRE-family HTH domain
MIRTVYPAIELCRGGGKMVDEVPEDGQAMRREAGSIDSEVGKRIRQRRIGLGISTHDFADKIGVPVQQITRYETGLNRVDIGLLHTISKVLTIDLIWFVVGSESADYISKDDPTAAEQLSALAEQFSRITDQRSRQQVIDLAKNLAEVRRSPRTSLN